MLFRMFELIKELKYYQIQIIDRVFVSVFIFTLQSSQVKPEGPLWGQKALMCQPKVPTCQFDYFVDLDYLIHNMTFRYIDLDYSIQKGQMAPHISWYRIPAIWLRKLKMFGLFWCQLKCFNHPQKAQQVFLYTKLIARMWQSIKVIFNLVLSIVPCLLYSVV